MLKVGLSSILLLLLITFNDLAKPVDSIPEQPVIVSNFTVSNPVTQPQECYNSAGLVLQAYIIPDLGNYCLGPCEQGYCCKITPAVK